MLNSNQWTEIDSIKEEFPLALCLIVLCTYALCGCTHACKTLYPVAMIWLELKPFMGGRSIFGNSKETTSQKKFMNFTRISYVHSQFPSSSWCFLRDFYRFQWSEFHLLKLSVHFFRVDVYLSSKSKPFQWFAKTKAHYSNLNGAEWSTLFIRRFGKKKKCIKFQLFWNWNKKGACKVDRRVISKL